MSVTHVAGLDVTVNGRYMRQRCAWCGDALIDLDLAAVMVQVAPGAAPEPPARWTPGALVRVDGCVSVSLEGDKLPDDACARAHPDLTALGEHMV
jgi:hypothetical protein